MKAGGSLPCTIQKEWDEGNECISLSVISLSVISLARIQFLAVAEYFIGFFLCCMITLPMRPEPDREKMA